MLFIEPRFFVFFLVVFAVHWGLRAAGLRRLWLLAASYAFYGAWDWRFLGLIAASTLIDFSVGLAIGRSVGVRAKRAWLAVSLACNLGLLGFFKYFGFFVSSGAEFLGWLGLRPSEVTLNIVLPVGISFYTFQTLSYTLDVYRGKLAPTRRLADFALFVAFFPQLVAGPIVRAVEFLPQLEGSRSFARDVRVRWCLSLFLIGFLKKICLADNAAIAVDRVFGDPGGFDTLSVWLSFSLYSVQAYGDFSGYSDMALALAGLLGYRLTRNFDFPFLARDVIQFWRRWHISLSRWLRDYLFVPLARSARGRASRLRVVLSIYVTMALCGLWHGAAWRFVAFGLVHATYMLVVRVWANWSKPAGIRWVSALLALPITYFCLTFTWPLFRGVEDGRVLQLYARLFFLEPGGSGTLGTRWLAFFVVVALVHAVLQRRRLESWTAPLSDRGFAFVYGAAWAVVLPLVALDYQPFMYFQF